MQYSRDELSQFPLQKLATLYPQTLEDETLLKEMFELRAGVSSYTVLTSVVDIKTKWQEEIVQKYVDLRRETMALENPASLSAEDESLLDANVITKEKELELQAKLDKKNKKKVVEEVTETPAEEIPVAVEAAPIETTPEVIEEPVKKVKNPKKK